MNTRILSSLTVCREKLEYLDKKNISLSDSKFYVSCPPQLIYCYRKSDLICRNDYRVLTVVNKDDNPEMIIDCK